MPVEQKWTIWRRLTSGRYVQVENKVTFSCLENVVHYYYQTYAHDDHNGTEILFVDEDGDIFVRKVEKVCDSRLNLVTAERLADRRYSR